MNVATLRTEVQRLVGRVDRGFNARTLRALNDALSRWAMKMPWPTLRRQETFVSEGTQTLLIPPRVGTIIWIGDRSNKVQMFPDSQLNRHRYPSLVDKTAGAPKLWNELGKTAVTKQPGAATPSHLVFNTATSDTFTVHVTGLAVDTNESGTPHYLYEAEEFLTINSTTDQTSTKLYAQIDGIGKNDITPDDLVTKNTDGDVISRLGRNDYVSSYRQVQLLFVPGAGDELDLEYFASPPALATDPQVPPPAVNPEYLKWYAAGILHRQQKEISMANEAFAQAQAIMNDRMEQEKQFGERDMQAQPDFRYWDHEGDLDLH